MLPTQSNHENAPPFGIIPLGFRHQDIPAAGRRIEDKAHSALARRQRFYRGIARTKVGLRLSLGVAWSLTIAAHDLDLFRLHRLTRVLHLECNVLDQESPDFVAESIRIKVTLYTFISLGPPQTPPSRLAELKYLERQPGLHLLRQNLSDAAIEVRKDLHRKLRFDAPLADQVIEGVRKRHADARG